MDEPSPPTPPGRRFTFRPLRPSASEELKGMGVDRVVPPEEARARVPFHQQVMREMRDQQFREGGYVREPLPPLPYGPRRASDPGRTSPRRINARRVHHVPVLTDEVSQSELRLKELKRRHMPSRWLRNCMAAILVGAGKLADAFDNPFSRLWNWIIGIAAVATVIIVTALAVDYFYPFL
jgi:hypothetical protein